MILITMLYVYVFANVEPYLQFLYRPWGNGDKPFLAALAMNADKAFLKEKVGDKEICQFADAKSTTIQHLYDAVVPDSFGLAHVYGGKNVVYLPDGKDLRQTMPDFW